MGYTIMHCRVTDKSKRSLAIPIRAIGIMDWQAAKTGRIKQAHVDSTAPLACVDISHPMCCATASPAEI
jgi:hypothetical protein